MQGGNVQKKPSGGMVGMVEFAITDLQGNIVSEWFSTQTEALESVKPSTDYMFIEHTTTKQEEGSHDA